MADVRLVAKGDPCPRCGAGLELYRGIEAGHIFMLGTHYTVSMKADFLVWPLEVAPYSVIVTPRS